MTRHALDITIAALMTAIRAIAHVNTVTVIDGESPYQVTLCVWYAMSYEHANWQGRYADCYVSVTADGEISCLANDDIILCGMPSIHNPVFNAARLVAPTLELDECLRDTVVPAWHRTGERAAVHKTLDRVYNTDHTIPAGTYPVIRHYCRSSYGYRLSIPMRASRSVWRSNRETIERQRPEIYWPSWYVYQIAEKAEKGEITLAPGWAVESEIKPSEYSESGYHTHRWFTFNGERVPFKGV